MTLIVNLVCFMHTDREVYMMCWILESLKFLCYACICFLLVGKFLVYSRILVVALLLDVFDRQ